MEDVEAEIRRKAAAVAVFVKMGLQVGLQGVPGGAQEKKKSFGAPPAEKKQGRREKSCSGRGMGEEKELWCPAVKEKAGKKRGNPSRAGHGEQKEACGAPPAEKKQGRREKI